MGTQMVLKWYSLTHSIQIMTTKNISQYHNLQIETTNTVQKAKNYKKFIKRKTEKKKKLYNSKDCGLAETSEC